MTGGRPCLEAALGPPWPGPRIPRERSEVERDVDDTLEARRRVMKFRRRAVELLRPHGLSFGLFQVLEATDRLVREYRDAVRGLDVAAECELGKSQAAFLMRTLSDRALVDIGLDCWGQAYRIILTKAGRALLVEARAAVARAARERPIRG
jgi:hypothetical protein